MLSRPTPASKREQAHREVEGRVGDREQLAAAEAGDGRVGERLVVAVAGEQAGRRAARQRLVAALDDQHAGGVRAGVELVGRGSGRYA